MDTIVCNLTAIPAAARGRHMSSAVQLFQATEAVQTLPDGYAFRLPNQSGMWLAAAQFIENERRCCAFFRFVLEVEPNNGAIWLRMTGQEGVKQLLETLFGDQPELAALTQLIQTGADAQLDQAVAQALPQFAGIIHTSPQAA